MKHLTHFQMIHADTLRFDFERPAFKSWNARPERTHPKPLAGPTAGAYLGAMCRNIDRDQQIAGWRAFVALLSGLKPRLFGAMGGALVLRRTRL